MLLEFSLIVSLFCIGNAIISRDDLDKLNIADEEIDELRDAFVVRIIILQESIENNKYILEFKKGIKTLIPFSNEELHAVSAKLCDLLTETNGSIQILNQILDVCELQEEDLMETVSKLLSLPSAKRLAITECNYDNAEDSTECVDDIINKLKLLSYRKLKDFQNILDEMNELTCTENKNRYHYLSYVNNFAKCNKIFIE